MKNWPEERGASSGYGNYPLQCNPCSKDRSKTELPGMMAEIISLQAAANKMVSSFCHCQMTSVIRTWLLCCITTNCITLIKFYPSALKDTYQLPQNKHCFWQHGITKDSIFHVIIWPEISHCRVFDYFLLHYTFR